MSCHILWRESWGLFHRAVSQSGSVLTLDRRPTTVTISKIAGQMGESTDIKNNFSAHVCRTCFVIGHVHWSIISSPFQQTRDIDPLLVQY